VVLPRCIFAVQGIFFFDAKIIIDQGHDQGQDDQPKAVNDRQVQTKNDPLFHQHGLDDIDQDKPSGLYDSTGIFCRWYGRWYDRDQGQSIQQPPQREEEEPTAICGALMFCRKDALDQVLIRGNEVFDSSFYMYKDDIDLSLRVRRANWKLAFVPQFTAYHCRGWNPDRSKMARRFRKMSARNELCIHLRNYSPLKACYSLCKYLGVLFLDL